MAPSGGPFAPSRSCERQIVESHRVALGVESRACPPIGTTTPPARPYSTRRVLPSPVRPETDVVIAAPGRSAGIAYQGVEKPPTVPSVAGASRRARMRER